MRNDGICYSPSLDRVQRVKGIFVEREELASASSGSRSAVAAILLERSLVPEDDVSGCEVCLHIISFDFNDVTQMCFLYVDML